VYRGQILVNWRPPTLEASQAFALAGANAVARRPGNHMPTIAAVSDNVAAMPIAGTKPAVNACGEPKLPVAANTATCTATPNTPPRKRDMLKVPEALPISLGATAPRTTFCAAGIAIDTPAPARTSGAMRFCVCEPGRSGQRNPGHADRLQPKPGDDERTFAHAVDEPATDRREDEQRGSPRQESQTHTERSVALRDLQELR
jgi:hypothetical protein